MPEGPAKALELPATRNRATIPVVSKEIFFIYYLLGLLSDGLSILMCIIILFCGVFLELGVCWISCNMELHLGTSFV